MKVAFTGTRVGMTEAQKSKLREILEISKIEEVHHGDCVGADEEFHDMTHIRPLAVVVHPPVDSRFRAYCGEGTDTKATVIIREPKPFLVRNKNIVDACEILIAAPAQHQEVIRSGTWSTVRYARRTGKTVVIL